MRIRLVKTVGGKWHVQRYVHLGSTTWDWCTFATGSEEEARRAYTRAVDDDVQRVLKRRADEVISVEDSYDSDEDA